LWRPERASAIDFNKEEYRGAMMRVWRFGLSAFALVLVTAAAPAWAELLSYDFQGTVTQTGILSGQTIAPVVNPGINSFLGQTFTATVTVDSSLSPRAVFVGQTYYNFQSFNVVFSGGYHFGVTGDDVRVIDESIGDSFTVFAEDYEVGANVVGAGLPGLTLRGADLLSFTDDRNALADTSLPPTLPPSEFTLNVDFLDANNLDYEILGTGVVGVPEPSLSFVFGVFCVGLLRAGCSAKGRTRPATL
jgi:hypothetical protein